jgi:hypothetical protein
VALDDAEDLEVLADLPEPVDVDDGERVDLGARRESGGEHVEARSVGISLGSSPQTSFCPIRIGT